MNALNISPTQKGYFLAILIALCSTICLAEQIQLEDLPHIDGTPLLDQEPMPWEILDWSETDDGIHWVWLNRGTTTSYLVYPNASFTEDAVTFPNGYSLPNMDRIQLHILGGDYESFNFTRFGGEIVLTGTPIEITYPLTFNCPEAQVTSDSPYISVSDCALAISGDVININGTFIDNYATIRDTVEPQEIRPNNVTLGTIHSRSELVTGTASFATLTQSPPELDLDIEGSRNYLFLNEELNSDPEPAIFQPASDEIDWTISSENTTHEASSQDLEEGSGGGTTSIWLILIASIVTLWFPPDKRKCQAKFLQR